MRFHLALITLLILVGALLGRGCLLRPATGYPGAHFNHGTNAAWLDVVWGMDPHTDEEIAT
jgi:hypothetical protein